MGVTGLWTVVHPSARPTNLSTLNRKRLAVDASIWIYQFLKAVRDKEGTALRNAHVVGFFRRICKLLFHGIKPVFVFDGGAPALKRQTISNRKRRREGRREDAVRTASKMLAVQMQRRAEEEEQYRKDQESGRLPEEETIPAQQDLVYVDEIGMSAQERQQKRPFRKKDAYHLPDLDVSLEEMGAPNDPRIMSQQELEEYARQFHSGEDINLYDFSKIDFDSPFFVSLPASDRYNILNAARVRSRLRTGYSKEQLDEMFPDRMAFSKFQIERVRERNELTQRLMNLNGMSGEDFLAQGARIAGEKGKEYVLVKNEGVEGGWALGVVSNKNEGRQEQPIDLETYGQRPDEAGDNEEWEDDGGFEDVPIEGLNRIPKRWGRKVQDIDYDAGFQERVDEIAAKRRAVYEARKQRTVTKLQQETNMEASGTNAAPTFEDPESLFVPENLSQKPVELEDEADELFEDVDMDQQQSEDDDLQRAIAMSLQKPDVSDDEVGGFIGDSFNQHNAKAGRDIARGINQRANTKAAFARRNDSSDDEEEDFDFRAALAQSSKSTSKQDTLRDVSSTTADTPKAPTKSQFAGPLPFESLNLGQSLLGKKKSQKIEQDLSGGFEKESVNEKPKTQPLPPWFNAGAPTKETVKEPQLQNESDESFIPHSAGRSKIRRNETKEVIDLEVRSTQEPEVIDLDASENEEEANESGTSHISLEHDQKQTLSPQDNVQVEEDPSKTDEISMDDIADLTRVDPPVTEIPKQPKSEEEAEPAEHAGYEEHVEWSDTDDEELCRREESRKTPATEHHQSRASKSSIPAIAKDEQVSSPVPAISKPIVPIASVDDEDDGEEFEDVDTSRPSDSRFKPPILLSHASTRMDEERRARAEALLIPDDAPDEPYSDEQAGSTMAVQSAFDNDGEEFIEDDSDDEIMRNLAIEAEEHARFAATLNNPLEPLPRSELPIVDYETELKQLRNQQKRDRRDADEVTQTMVHECQMLLAKFGLPYITAPMEAEAQCAELVHLGLVDGIITDDSDVFLFGGTRIYKNMFNAAKLVECYLTSDLEREYTLTRQKLISFAHLLGSDYTEGIPGVGPVTALEILTEFPDEEGGLTGFREWWSKAQLTDPKHLPPPSEEPHYDFLRKYKKQLTKLFLPPHFPDQRVNEAYLNPEVDSTPESFQWGVPDLSALRSFLMATIGWSQERTDEILVPVIRDMNRRDIEGTQSNITKFFGGSVGVGARQPIAGNKRVDRGIEGSGGSGGNAGTNDAEREVFAPRVRESGRMAKAFGRLRGEAERKRRRASTEHSGNGTAEKAATAEVRADGGGSSASATPKRRKKTATTVTASKKMATAPIRGKASEGAKGRTRRRRRAGNDEDDDDEDDQEAGFDGRGDDEADDMYDD